MLLVFPTLFISAFHLTKTEGRGPVLSLKASPNLPVFLVSVFRRAREILLLAYCIAVSLLVFLPATGRSALRSPLSPSRCRLQVPRPRRRRFFPEAGRVRVGVALPSFLKLSVLFLWVTCAGFSFLGPSCQTVFLRDFLRRRLSFLPTEIRLLPFVPCLTYCF